MQPFLSILIPTYNPNEQLLSDLLKSIFMQNDNDLEIIIIDDCSSNQAIYNIINNEYKNYTQLKLVQHAENKGTSAAINTGIGVSSSQYLTHIGDDDLFLPSTFLYIKPYLEHMLSYPHIAGGYTGLINIPHHFTLNEVLKNYNFLTHNKHYYQEINFLTFRTGPTFATHQVFLKTEIAKKTLYKEDMRYGADHEFWLRLLRNGYEFNYLQKMGALYRQREKSISHISSHLAEGLIARLAADDALSYPIKPEDVIKDAPFVYNQPIEYYYSLITKIQKIANWAAFAKAGGDLEVYKKIISLMPSIDPNLSKIANIRAAIKSGFIRHFSIKYIEKDACLVAEEARINHEINQVFLDLTKIKM